MFFKKMAQSRPIFPLFLVFSNNSKKLKQIIEKMIHLVMQCRDLNLQALDHQSHPITTRPGIPLQKA